MPTPLHLSFQMENDMSKTTIVCLESARHFQTKSSTSMHHSLRHNGFKAIRHLLPEATLHSIMVSPLDEAVALMPGGSSWTDMPLLPEECFSYRNCFHPLEPDPSDDYGWTVKLSEETCQVPSANVSDVVILGLPTMCVARTMARVVPLLAQIGHRPERILAVRASFAGYGSQWISWDEAVAMAGRHMPSIRFDSLYDLNFRGIALKAIRHCIVAADIPFAQFDRDFASRAAGVGTYRPAFIALLEAIGRRGEGTVVVCRSSNPGIEIWRRAVEGDASWIRIAEGALKQSGDAYFSPNASLHEPPPITNWIGSGSLPPLSAPPFAANPYPAPYLAAQRALQVGFITCGDSGPRLTASGRLFLDMLPKKVKDLDAPIRWNALKPEDVPRADAWLSRHFGMMKRTINRIEFTSSD